MIKVKETTTIIHKKDLDKLSRKAGLSLRQLSKKAGINYIYLINCNNGKGYLSTDKWNDIKKVLETYPQISENRLILE